MATPIFIEVGNIKLKAELSKTPTARAIAKALPIEAEFDTWGDVYALTIPVDMPLDETATHEVLVGDLGYSPDGKTLLIFYGPTPASPSESDRPVPPADINPVGRITDDPTILRVVAGIGKVRLSRRSASRKKKK